MEQQIRYQQLVRKYCVFSTSLLVVLITINLIIAIGIQGRTLPDGTIRMIILLFIHLLSLFLGQKSPRIASTLFLLGVYLAFFIYPLLPFFNSKPGEDLFLYIFLALFMNSIVVVLTDFSNRWEQISWFIVVNITFIFGLFYTVNQLDSELYGSIQDIFNEVPILYFSIPLVCIFMGLIVRKFKSEHLKGIQKLTAATEELKKQENSLNDKKKELADIIQALEQSEMNLNNANDSLNSLIQKRIDQLEDLNGRILNHGFLHSKVIQSAFKKILIEDQSLQTMDLASQFTHYQKVVQELDQVIGDIGENLHLAELELNG